MSAALPMGSNKITGMADPTVSTDAATKNYVDTTTAAFFSTGDIKLTLKTTPDSGWLLFDDGTFGNVSSGSSNSNSAANLALFTLFFANLSDTAAPLLTSGGAATTRAAQTNAATAWAANCRMTLAKTLGRALGIAGAGAGLTSRPLGSTVGAETNALSSTNQLPQFTPAGSVSASAPVLNNNNVAGGTDLTHLALGNGGNASAGSFGITASFSGTPIGSASPSSFSVMEPTTFLNAMVKL